MNIKKYIDIFLAFTFKREGGGSIKTRRTPQPERVKDYILVRDLQPEKHYPFKIGVYQNTQGEKFVIKVWKGIRNIHYYDLQHQISVLRVMNAVTERESKRFPKGIIQVKWPRLIEVIEMGDMTAVVTDFINAKPVESIKDLDTQWNYYINVEKYLNYICTKLKIDEINEIKRKSLINFLFLLPAITTLAIIENPKKTLLILNAVINMVRAIPAFINYNKYALIHGDLNYGNIMVNEKDVYLIDVEQTNVSYEEFELVTTLSTLGNTPRFKKRVTEKILANAKTDSELSQRLGFLMLNCEVHNLTWNAPQENKDHYLELIDFGIKLVNNKY